MFDGQKENCTFYMSKDEFASLPALRRVWAGMEWYFDNVEFDLLRAGWLLRARNIVGGDDGQFWRARRNAQKSYVALMSLDGSVFIDDLNQICEEVGAVVGVIVTPEYFDSSYGLLKCDLLSIAMYWTNRFEVVGRDYFVDMSNVYDFEMVYIFGLVSDLQSMGSRTPSTIKYVQARGWMSDYVEKRCSNYALPFDVLVDLWKIPLLPPPPPIEVPYPDNLCEYD